MEEYQIFKSVDNDHLSITNCNQACLAKMAPRGFQEERNVAFYTEGDRKLVRKPVEQAYGKEDY